MNIYVYQIDPYHHSAGFIESVCRKRGRIVESYPVDTVKECDFVISHGSKHVGAQDRVVQLAERAKRVVIGDLSPVEPSEAWEAMMIDLCSERLRSRLWRALKLIFGRF